MAQAANLRWLREAMEMARKLLDTGRLIVPVILLLLSACQSSPSPVLSKECAPPCWRGIQPGRTPFQDAVDKVKKFQDYDPKGAGIGKSWKILDSYVGFKLEGGENILIGAINDVVELIIFGNPKGITFQKSVEELGTPEYVGRSLMLGQGLPILPASDAMHTYLFIVSPSQGVVYGADMYNPWTGLDTNLAPNAAIIDLRFFDNRIFDKLLSSGLLVYSNERFSREELYPWKGYGDIRELYPDP